MILVVLDTMWGTPGRAPRTFRISPHNHSGRRLYRLIGHSDFKVTNACSVQVGSPNHHGTPDPEWLANTLRTTHYNLLILGGRVASDTYARCGYVPACKVLIMPHPAARTWTSGLIAQWQQRIRVSQGLGLFS